MIPKSFEENEIFPDFRWLPDLYFWVYKDLSSKNCMTLTKVRKKGNERTFSIQMEMFQENKLEKKSGNPLNVNPMIIWKAE